MMLPSPPPPPWCRCPWQAQEKINEVRSKEKSITDARIKEVQIKLAKQTEQVKATEAKYLKMCEELKNRERETQQQTAHIKALISEHETATKKVTSQDQGAVLHPHPPHLYIHAHRTHAHSR